MSILATVSIRTRSVLSDANLTPMSVISLFGDSISSYLLLTNRRLASWVRPAYVRWYSLSRRLFPWSIHQSAAMLCHLLTVISSAIDTMRSFVESFILRSPLRSNLINGTSLGRSFLDTLDLRMHMHPMMSRSSMSMHSIVSESQWSMSSRSFSSERFPPSSSRVLFKDSTVFIPFAVRK